MKGTLKLKTKYIVIENRFINGDKTRVGYGIAAVTEQDGISVVLESYSDISPDADKVRELANDCNTYGLSKAHLSDVVEDFLATV